ncbi:hypothetical protein BVY04_04875 [bacterium M21]|nr:hypothetical protein BVY04_04875 [bacterium M21]
MIKPQYSFLTSSFSNGLAMVSLSQSKGTKKGDRELSSLYIDKKNRNVFGRKFDLGSAFENGVATVYRKEKTWHINTKGEMIRPIEMLEGQDVRQFMNRIKNSTASIKSNRFIICEGMSYGFIDRSGTKIVPCKFDAVRPYRGGRAAVRVGEKWGILALDGSVVADPSFAYIRDYFGGLCAFFEKGKWGYLNAKGEVAIKPRFTMAWDFHNGWARIVANGRYFFINAQGKRLHIKGYQFAGDFYGALAPVMNDGEFWYIKKDGKKAFERKFDLALAFTSHGLAPVYLNGKWGVVNHRGQVILVTANPPTIKEGVIRCRPKDRDMYHFWNSQGKPLVQFKRDNTTHYSDGWIKHLSRSRISYYSTKGKLMLRVPRAKRPSMGFSKNQDIGGAMGDMFGRLVRDGVEGDFHEGLAIHITEDDRWGYFDKKGRMVIKPRFDSAEPYFDGVAEVNLADDHKGYVNREGKLIWKSETPSIVEFNLPSAIFGGVKKEPSRIGDGEEATDDTSKDK